MRVIIVVLLLVVAMASSTQANEKPVYDVGEAPELFEKFIKEHNREYKDEEDKRIHFEAFKASLVKINDLNSKDTHATFGINKFADYTEEERKQMFGHGIIKKKD